MGIQAPEFIARGTPLKSLAGRWENPVLVISNPHGLHASTIVEAAQAGFKNLVCEKPVCVNQEELNLLRPLASSINLATLHGYRQMWGPQKIKKMLSDDVLGTIISIEGRYWQASAAERALQASQGEPPKKTWKNDLILSGGSDTFLDLSTHWVDLCCYFFGEVPLSIIGWKSFLNADAPYRDTHIELMMKFAHGRALGSVSKTVHGATNHLEVNVIGTKKSVTWSFLSPDEIIIGEGRDLRVETRKENNQGSSQAPFHGTGWLEGYIEILKNFLENVHFGQPVHYPTLQESLNMMDSLFATDWH